MPDYQAIHEFDNLAFERTEQLDQIEQEHIERRLDDQQIERDQTVQSLNDLNADQAVWQAELDTAVRKSASASARANGGLAPSLSDTQAIEEIFPVNPILHVKSSAS